jgi:Leucine-rich repeat (LRR) protein
LHDLEHIFQVEELDFSELGSFSVYEDYDYNPEEVWDDSDPGFNVFDTDHMPSPDEFEDMPIGKEDRDDFISAVKRKIYGPMEIDLPVQLLEDIEDIEMASYDIGSLEGVRFCKHAVEMDLSGNHINDITEIGECRFLKALYLSHNQISIIDALGNLAELKEVDLSYNLVDDLSPLSGLKNLAYVNIIGNPVPNEQIAHLKKRGVLVVN